MKKLSAMLVIAIMLLAVLPTATLPASAAGTQKTTLSISVPSSVYSQQTFNIVGKLVAGISGTGIDGMSVTVYRSTDGKKWTRISTVLTSGGGLYTVPTSESVGGTYQYKATFSGHKIYSSANSIKVRVTVDPKMSTILTLTIDPAWVYAGGTMKVTACLKDAAGKPIQGQRVGITNGASSMTMGPTNSEGITTMGISPPVGVYNFWVTFDGVDQYTPATSDKVPVEVKAKPLITTTLTLNQPNSAIAGEPMTFTGTLTAADDATMFGKDIHIQIYNPGTQQYEDLVTTATNGVGAFSVSKPIGAEGTYQVQAVYDGGTGYASDTSDPCSVEVKVNPKTTLDFTMSPNQCYVGDKVTMTVKLTDANGVGMPNKYIVLERYDPTQQGWSYEYRTATDESGIFTDTSDIYASEVGSTKYRFVTDWFGEDINLYEPSTSNEIPLAVTLEPTTLDLTVSPTEAFRGETITFSGALKDDSNVGIPGQTVTLEFTDPYGNVFSQTVETGASGEYQFSTGFDAVATFKVKAVFNSANGYATAASEEVHFVVNPGSIL